MRAGGRADIPATRQASFLSWHFFIVSCIVVYSRMICQYPIHHIPDSRTIHTMRVQPMRQYKICVRTPDIQKGVIGFA
jgi:hypothetical protein